MSSDDRAKKKSPSRKIGYIDIYRQLNGPISIDLDVVPGYPKAIVALIRKHGCELKMMLDEGHERRDSAIQV